MTSWFSSWCLFNIKKAQITKPNENSNEFIFNGLNQTYVLTTNPNYTISEKVRTFSTLAGISEKVYTFSTLARICS